MGLNGNIVVRRARDFKEFARELGKLISDPELPPLYVSGRNLYDGQNNLVVLRGIKLPLLDDWEFSSKPAPRAVYTPEMQFGKLEELAKTRVNTVRIQWYAQYPETSRPQYDIRHLDAVLEKCQRNCLIPIVELHDCTCNPDPKFVNEQLIPWWTNPRTVEVLKKHEQYLIINLANELGTYRWVKPPATPAAALNTFKVAYKDAITKIRDQGLRMPIMIDAPDCGTSINAFTQIGQELIDHDPRHSLLLSVHAYWGGYNGTAEIVATVNANLPIVFGEVANKQASEKLTYQVLNKNGQLETIEYVDECHIALDGTGKKEADADVKLVSDNENNPYKDANGKPIPIKTNLEPPIDPNTNTFFKYQDLLPILAAHNIGWLAWAWYKDKCEPRRMTTNGNYTELTPYGTYILNQLKISKRTPILPMKRISPDMLRRFPFLAHLPKEWIQQPLCQQDYTPHKFRDRFPNIP